GAHASGEILAFTDDDCAPHPGWLRALATAFARQPTALVGGQIVNVLHTDHCANASQLLVSYLYSYYNAEPDRASFFTSNNIAVPARHFRAIGGFDISYPRAAAEDREFCDRWRLHGFPMVYAADAVVRHAHAMQLRAFWRQHFNYGRGAYQFHRGRARRRQSQIKVEPTSFYIDLLRYPFSQTPGARALPLATLLAVSQAANVLGFFWERHRHRHARFLAPNTLEKCMEFSPSWTARLPQKVGQRVITTLTASWLAWSLIGVGVLVRLLQYLSNRALWMDEALLALNIVERDFVDLLRPLDNMQAVPLGFLMIERLMVTWFGESEYALRLFPFLASIAALLLFYAVARAILSPAAVPLALGLYVVLEPLIYYSSEAKQYASDVTAALLVLVLAIAVVRAPSLWRIAALGLAGAVLPWLSHPVVFILGGVGISLALWLLVQRKWLPLAMLVVIGLIWLLSFAGSYRVSLLLLGDYTAMQASWSDNYLPDDEGLISGERVRWIINTFFSAFELAAGFTKNMRGLAAFCFLIGIVAFAARERITLALLLTPLLLTILAAALQLYPLHGRLLLFCVPILLLLIAKGIYSIGEQIGRTSLVPLILLALLVFEPVLQIPYHLAQPREREELRAALDYARPRMLADDTVYVYYSAQHAYAYYTRDEPLPSEHITIGREAREDWLAYLNDFAALRGEDRVWIIFAHNHTGSGVNEQRFFEYALGRLGTRQDQFKTTEAAVYLYDLSAPPGEPLPAVLPELIREQPGSTCKL
ncbi:glycosyltransferase, partial [Candidatus Gracilibacteria bacterium]|nr:glycosyltransferase [Candidatus Gracilibacteria bacterium]